MPIVVQAVSKEEFDQWVAAHKENSPMMQKEAAALLQPLSEQELLKLGKAQYDKSCVMCHQSDGRGLPPSFPALKKSRVVTGALDASIAYVMTGVPGTAMQNFGDQLNDRELASVITYIRHAWGNEELVLRHKNMPTAQPTDVMKVRQSKNSGV